jgi:hypothetical protein
MSILNNKFEWLEFAHGFEEAFDRYEKAKGKLIIAEAVEDDATRLFIRSCNDIIDATSKKGWWNTFTITRKPSKRGVYVCRVNEVKHDKDFYPYFVVETIFEIPESSLINEALMFCFMFSEQFTDVCQYSDYFNLYFLGDHISSFLGNEELPRSTYDRFKLYTSKAVDLLLEGKISIEDITEWLNEPSDEEKAEKAFSDEVEWLLRNHIPFPDSIRTRDLKSPWPLTAGKYLKTHDRYTSLLTAVNFFKGILEKYEAAVCAGKIERVDTSVTWDKLEAYLKFDEARKAASKAAKTAAKKAKKRGEIK